MAGRFSAARVGGGPDKSAMKSIITGGAGEGKTWLVSTITDADGGPIFMLPIEEGLKGACPDAKPQGFKDDHERWITPMNLGEVMQALDTFMLDVNAPVEVQGPNGPVKRRPYRHLGIDSLTGIERFVLEAACGLEKARHLEDKDFKKVWTAAMPLWQAVQSKIDEVRRSGVNVWLIAHATEDFDASATSGMVYKKWDLMLRGSGKTLVETRHFWRSWADNIWYVARAVNVRAGDKQRRSMASLGGRILVCQDTGNIAAKSRLNVPPTVPATWADIQKAIRAGAAVKVDKAREEVVVIAARLEPEDRAAVEADLAAVKTPTQMAAVLSRAKGMLTILSRENGEPEDGSAEQGAPPDPSNGAPTTLSDEEKARLIDAGQA
jgi:AAA domain